MIPIQPDNFFGVSNKEYELYVPIYVYIYDSHHILSKDNSYRSERNR